MARTVKCKYCNKKILNTEAFKQEVSVGSKTQNWYFCNKEEARQYRIDLDTWKTIMFALDVLAKDKIAHSSKAKKIKDILNQGYTKTDIYCCLVEMVNDIYLENKMKYDIETPYQKLCYLSVVIENNIARIHKDNTRADMEQQYTPTVEVFKEQTKVKNNRRKTLRDKINEKLQDNNKE